MNISEPEEQVRDAAVRRRAVLLFEFVSGCPMCYQVRGFGCSRLLATYPQPVSWSLWSVLSDVPRARCGVSFDVLVQVVGARQQVIERPKPLSSGGDMRVCASSQGVVQRHIAPVA